MVDALVDEAEKIMAEGIEARLAAADDERRGDRRRDARRAARRSRASTPTTATRRSTRSARSPSDAQNTAGCAPPWSRWRCSSRWRAPSGGPVGSAVAAKKPRPIATAPFTAPTDVALADTPPPWALPANARPYVEAARSHGARRGAARGALPRAPRRDRRDGAKVTVPAGIGFEVSNGKVTGLTVLHTHDTSGVIHIESAANKPYTLGQVFTEWGVALNADPGRRPPRRRLARAEGLRERPALLRRPRHDQAAAPPRDRALVRPERPDPQGPELVPLPGWALRRASDARGAARGRRRRTPRRSRPTPPRRS